MQRERSSSKMMWFGISMGGVILLSVMLSDGFFTPFRAFVQTVLAPFEWLVSSTSDSLQGEIRLFKSFRDLDAENDRLRTENTELKSNEARLAELLAENESLRKMAQMGEKEGFERKGATVIVRDSLDRGKWIFLNQGALDGMKAGMPVLAPGDVLIGFIDESYPKSSRVKLLFHPESVIPGRIAGSETKGVVRGEHGLGMILDLIPQSSDLSRGSFVVTDNLEGNIPSGLLIGTVQDPQPSADRLFLQSVVLPAIDSDLVRFVTILIPKDD